MNRVLLVTNRKTNETLEMLLEEFKGRFSNEINVALSAFKKIQLSKKPYISIFGKIDEVVLEPDFYFDLQWNFNNLSNSAWYIAKFVS